MYMILSRYLNLDRHIPSLTVQQGDPLMLTVTETIDSSHDLTGRPPKGAWIKENKILSYALLLVTLFGASCVMADGLLTPAISVISAVAGKYLQFCYSSQVLLSLHRVSTVRSFQSPLQSLSFSYLIPAS